MIFCLLLLLPHRHMFGMTVAPHFATTLVYHLMWCGTGILLDSQKLLVTSPHGITRFSRRARRGQLCFNSQTTNLANFVIFVMLCSCLGNLIINEAVFLGSIVYQRIFFLLHICIRVMPHSNWERFLGKNTFLWDASRTKHYWGTTLSQQWSKTNLHIFTNSATLGRVGHRVAISVCLSVCLFACAIGCSFF